MRVVTVTQNKRSRTHLDGTTLDQSIICRQLFAGNVDSSQPTKKERFRMIKLVVASVIAATISSYSSAMLWQEGFTSYSDLLMACHVNHNNIDAVVFFVF